jgi:hypothetical protein
VGAGAGATVGKLFGIQRSMKGGIGTASVTVGDFTVAALVAVNAIGDVIGADGRVLAGARSSDGADCVGATQRLLAGDSALRVMGTMTGTATTAQKQSVRCLTHPITAKPWIKAITTKYLRLAIVAAPSAGSKIAAAAAAAIVIIAAAAASCLRPTAHFSADLYP